MVMAACRFLLQGRGKKMMDERERKEVRDFLRTLGDAHHYLHVAGIEAVDAAPVHESQIDEMERAVLRIRGEVIERTGVEAPGEPSAVERLITASVEMANGYGEVMNDARFRGEWAELTDRVDGLLKRMMAAERGEGTSSGRSQEGSDDER